MSNNNLISNLSYTSKDFNTIYPEMLDLVKKITYRWDPSISNESDPGVILLKLNAIIADKLNYNIDKNVLECYPESVSQVANARQLYAQLGYYMHWYKAASTIINIKYTGDLTDGYVTIPKFTMVSDYYNEMVYTLTGLANAEEHSATDQKLYFDGTKVAYNALQGVAVNYDINGVTDIQVSDLDVKNRLYFNCSDVAENGVFITNIGVNNYASWVRKDNLAVENIGNTFYEFGVDITTGACYLQFPDDAEDIFGSGINITYVRTSGFEGNAKANLIEKFYNDLSATAVVGEEESSIILNADNVSISNITAGTGGKDAETLEEAKKAYKQTIGTFNTLITLRDYMNAIVNAPKMASNAFATDRSTDIQCVYKIVSTSNSLDVLVNKIDSHKYQGDPCLNAYNIKLYVLKYVAETIDNTSNFNETFKLLSDDEQSQLRFYIEDQKAISHDYASIITPTFWNEFNSQYYSSSPTGWPTGYYYKDASGEIVAVPAGTTFTAGTYYTVRFESWRTHICMIKDVYPLEVTITTDYEYDSVLKAEILSKIKAKLYDSLNSKHIEFGEPMVVSDLETLIESADDRISNASIFSITYKTYAVYWNGEEFREVLIGEKGIASRADAQVMINENEGQFVYSATTRSTFKNVRANETLITTGVWNGWKTINKAFMIAIGRGTAAGGPTGSLPRWAAIKFTYYDDGTTQQWLRSIIMNDSGWSTPVVESSLNDWAASATVPSVKKSGDWFVIEYNPALSIRDEIFLKSVLAGTTPLQVEDKDFTFAFNQYSQHATSYPNTIYSNVEAIEGYFTATPDEQGGAACYTLQTNESVRFTTKNLIEAQEYSNYVKYLWIGSSNLQTGANQAIQNGEYLCLFYKDSDDELEPYRYDIYGGPDVTPGSTVVGFNAVYPTFEIPAASSTVPQ